MRDDGLWLYRNIVSFVLLGLKRSHETAAKNRREDEARAATPAPKTAERTLWKDVDSRNRGYFFIQNGEILYTTQRPNELGYTYDILDVRLNNHTILAAKSNYVAILKSNQNKILFPKALWTQFKSYMMKHYSHIPSRVE